MIRTVWKFHCKQQSVCKFDITVKKLIQFMYIYADIYRKKSRHLSTAYFVFVLFSRIKLCFIFTKFLVPAFFIDVALTQQIYVCSQLTCWQHRSHYSSVQAPVPLSIFRSNSKFDENSECSSFEYTRPITTIFCTRHDSDTVVTCAKYRCDRPRILYTRVFWIFIEFRIRSKYA